MRSERLTDAEIRAAGWEALVERLGPAGALRFSIQTQRGYGDYSQLRHQMFGALSVDNLVAQVRAARPRQRRQRASKRR